MKSFVPGLLGICTAAVVMASAAYAGPTSDPGVHARMKKQQHRIHHGVASGRLTLREFAKLEREEARIRRHELRMKSDGLLTRGERTRLHRELNRANRHICREKHDRQRRWS